MKTKFAFLAIMLLAVVFGFVNPVSSQIKVGFVDSEVILKQLPESKKVQEQLEAIQKQYLDTITGKENELKTKAEDFKTQYEAAQKKVESGEVKSEAEIKALNEEINALQKELQLLDDGLTAYKQKAREDLLSIQSELFKPIKDKVIKTIEDVSKEMKINFVFDKAEGTLLYGDKEFDITFKVLDKLK